MKNEKKSCNETVHCVSPADLPLSCPLKEHELWNAHPKVYLPIEKTGKVTCPYCGTHYFLMHD